MPPTFPTTAIHYRDRVTFGDIHPDTGAGIAFPFTRQMIAWPLTTNGAPGSAPNNKASWWPYFQERHKRAGLYWVQGHLLNHRIHGPGVPENLVPISNTTNTNMEAIIEAFAKKHVDDGDVLYYEVNAHFDGPKSMREWPADVLGTTRRIEADIKAAGGKPPEIQALAHPQLIRRTYGLDGSAANPGTLLWGEQFAPTRLSWMLKRSTNWKTAPDWKSRSHQFEVIAHDLDSHISPDGWYNTFPQ
jgi:hypothetical protein